MLYQIQLRNISIRHFALITSRPIFSTGIFLSLILWLLSYPTDAGSLEPRGSYAAQSTTVVQGQVYEVKDGDTIVIAPANGGKFFVCRLYGIDAPEKNQKHGNEATQALKKLILGQVVKSSLTGDKTYGREVCIIEMDSLNVNLEMVRQGHAWAYRQYLKRPYASEFIGAEEEARTKGLGLWRDKNPMPPWEFRNKR